MILRTLVAMALAALAASACTTASAAQLPTHVAIRVHYSHFDQTKIDVPMGVPITFTLVNDDPIDQEWLIGDETFHARHRAGTEAVHGDRPNEVSLPPLSVKTTTITFDNEDPGVLHNIQFFSDKDYTTSIYKGPDVTGVASAQYQLRALGPGTYYFHCDYHPTTMQGTITVAKSGGGSSPSGASSASSSSPSG